MAIREILKMGDPRLLRIAQPVAAFDTDALHLLVRDMFETMHAVNGAGLRRRRSASTSRSSSSAPTWSIPAIPTRRRCRARCWSIR